MYVVGVENFPVTLPNQSPVTAVMEAGVQPVIPSWWRTGIDYFDVVAVGGGASGGFAGSFAGYTAQSLSSSDSFSAIGGYGGVGGSPVAGQSLEIEINDTIVVAAPGGGIDANVIAVNSGAGNYTYQGITYVGGTGGQSSAPGNPPGGGGATSYAGANGGAWITFRQNTGVPLTAYPSLFGG